MDVREFTIPKGHLIWVRIDGKYQKYQVAYDTLITRDDSRIPLRDRSKDDSEMVNPIALFARYRDVVLNTLWRGYALWVCIDGVFHKYLVAEDAPITAGDALIPLQKCPKSDPEVKHPTITFVKFSDTYSNIVRSGKKGWADIVSSGYIYSSNIVEVTRDVGQRYTDENVQVPIRTLINGKSIEMDIWLSQIKFIQDSSGIIPALAGVMIELPAGA